MIIISDTRRQTACDRTRSRSAFGAAKLGSNQRGQEGREQSELNPALLATLERDGRERSLIYRTLALTGLRRSELASITAGQVILDGAVPHIVLNPGDEKNRKGATIPLRPDLAADLQNWMDENRTLTMRPGISAGQQRLFKMPSSLNRVFDHDLDAAGIAKRDDRNRVMDIHALRVTFASHLCAAGVPLRTAQAALRHSKPELTANLYTDPQLLDVAGALAALPAFNAHVAPLANKPASA
ncbi:MAG: tyrosine-type recombinase/integrase [Planctomycetes bacterium]|nr:tyrosine-type recombinase/integrase [Planctomycetota bacterium]